MKKVILAFLFLTMASISAGGVVPYDNMELEYKSVYEFRNQQYPGTNYRDVENLNLAYNDGEITEKKGRFDFIGDYFINKSLEEDNSTALWLKGDISTQDKVRIGGREYTITSKSTNVELEKFGNTRTIEARYEYYSPSERIGDTTFSDYSRTVRRFYHPKSRILVGYIEEISYNDYARGSGVMEKSDIIRINIIDNENDVDGDGLTDLEELIKHNTDPIQTDTDADNLTDENEVSIGTNPQKSDTDGDGINDGREQELGTEPTESDSDEDSLEDQKEINIGTNPTEADTDSDGLDDGRERRLGTSPTEADSDSDGLDDAREVEIGSDPNEADSDQDGLKDGREVDIGTSPTESDTDGDSLNDQTDPMPTTPILPNGVIALGIAAIGGIAYRRKRIE
ncbi:hypothetical protein [Candidatus Nanohalococcus occultus]